MKQLHTGYETLKVSGSTVHHVNEVARDYSEELDRDLGRFAAIGAPHTTLELEAPPRGITSSQYRDAVGHVVTHRMSGKSSTETAAYDKAASDEVTELNRARNPDNSRSSWAVFKVIKYDETPYDPAADDPIIEGDQVQLEVPDYLPDDFGDRPIHS